jgi:hypothetical protein
MQTTLNKIKYYSPCKDGWEKLLNHLNKLQADNEILELRTILESNGLDDTIWALRTVEGKDKEIRLFAADCAELVLPIYENGYPNDTRPRLAIEAARDYANGLITLEELAAAWDATRDAAMDAAMAAAKDAAMDAAMAASAAAWAAARAAWDATRDAAMAADAASAAMAADAASAASAAGAAWAARAARAAAWAEIKQILLKYI